MLKHYGQWTLTERRSFSDAEKAAVASATVVPSQYGASVCFMMKSGGCTYVPLSSQSSASIGDSIDVAKCFFLTLTKPGEADIHRIEI